VILLSNFIFMLTQNDVTIKNAKEVYEEVRNSGLEFVGFKDVGLPFEQLKELTALMQAGGHKVMLEVVSLNKEDELKSARAAVDLGVDYLVGGKCAKEIAEILKGSPIQFYPFPGLIVGHPSKLRGTIDEIVQSAKNLAAMEGVHGLDLLAYRFDGDVEELVERVVKAINIPLIAAGSIDTKERIEKMNSLGVWGFTVGSAIFDGKFGTDSVRTQVEKILEYSNL
jgi:pyridoxal biosynthesis lyase PdxS